MRIFYKILFLMGLCFSSKSSFAGDGFDSLINAWLSPISNKIAGTVFYSFSVAGADIKIIVLWLIAGSIFCTFYFSKLQSILKSSPKVCVGCNILFDMQ